MVSLLAVQNPGAHAVSCLSSVLLLTTQCSSWSLIWRPNYLSGKDGFKWSETLLILAFIMLHILCGQKLSCLFKLKGKNTIILLLPFFFSQSLYYSRFCILRNCAGHLCLSYIHPSLCVFSSIFFYLLSLNLDLRVICLNDIQRILSIPFLLVSIMSHHLIRLMVLNTYGLSSLSNLSIKRCPLLMATF